MKKTGILFCLITMLNACTTATTEPTADLSPTETTMPPTTTPIPPTATDTATVRPQNIGTEIDFCFEILFTQTLVASDQRPFISTVPS